MLDLRQQIAKGEAAFDHAFGDAEGGRNVAKRAAFLREPREGLVLRNLVGIEARDVFDERGFEGCRVVARLHDGARDQSNAALFFRCLLGTEIPPPARDDLVAVRVGTDEKRLQDAACAHARQDVGNIRRFPVVAHIDCGDVQLFERDML